MDLFLTGDRHKLNKLFEKIIDSTIEGKITWINSKSDKNNYFHYIKNTSYVFFVEDIKYSTFWELSMCSGDAHKKLKIAVYNKPDEHKEGSRLKNFRSMVQSSNNLPSNELDKIYEMYVDKDDEKLIMLEKSFKHGAILKNKVVDKLSTRTKNELKRLSE